MHTYKTGVQEYWSIGVLEPAKTAAGYALKVISCADSKKPHEVRKHVPVKRITPLPHYSINPILHRSNLGEAPKSFLQTMDNMTSITKKKELILKYEEKFADSVAVAVIDKPKLNLWMILIPIIFLHYFYRMKKFVDGRKEFAQHFILTRKRALEEAVTSIESGGKPDVDALVKMSSAPRETHPDYKKWLEVLLDHYLDLLGSEGDSFETLIHSGYKTKTNHLLFLNHLNRVERQFNTALKPSLSKTTEGVDHIVSNIEQRCKQLRTKEAESIFQ